MKTNNIRNKIMYGILIISSLTLIYLLATLENINYDIKKFLPSNNSEEKIETEWIDLNNKDIENTINMSWWLLDDEKDDKEILKDILEDWDKNTTSNKNIQINSNTKNINNKDEKITDEVINDLLEDFDDELDKEIIELLK